MTDPSDLQQRLHRARELFAPSTAQRERVRSGLAARPDFRAPSDEPPHAVARSRASAAGSSTAGSSTAGSSTTRWGVAKRAAAKAPRALALVKGGVLLGVGFVLGFWFAEKRASEHGVTASIQRAVVDSSAAAEPRPSGAPSDVESASKGPAASAGAPSASRSSGASASASPAHPATERAHGTLSSPTAPASPAARRAHARPADAASASREELALLQRAERAIRSGDGALALSFIDELDARFPKTIWREERDAVLVLAACTLDEPGARERARAFLQRHPSSMYLDRIDTVCEIDDGVPLETSGADGSPTLGHSSGRRKIP